MSELNEFLDRKRSEAKSAVERHKPATRETWFDRILHVARALAEGRTQNAALAEIGIPERSLQSRVQADETFRSIVDAGRAVGLESGPTDTPAALRMRLLNKLRSAERSRNGNHGQPGGRADVLAALDRAREDELARGRDAQEAALRERARQEEEVARLETAEQYLVREVRELGEAGRSASMELKQRELAATTSELADARRKLQAMR